VIFYLGGDPAWLVALMYFPKRIYGKLEIWRLLTGLYFLNDFFIVTLLISLWMFRSYLNGKERELGTARFFAYFLINGVVGGILMLPLYWIFIQFYQQADGAFMFPATEPIWCLIMCEMVIYNMSVAEEIRYFCGYPTVRNKYIHWIFAGLICLIFFVIPVDFVTGILLGYLHYWGKMKWMILSANLGERADEWAPFKLLRKIGNYRESEGGLLEPGNADAGPNIEQPAANQQSQPDDKRFPGPGYTVQDPSN
jgi:hypothetical protein